MNKLKDKYKQILEDCTESVSLSNKFARENLDEIFGLFGSDEAPSSGAMPKRTDFAAGAEGDKAHSDALRTWGGKEKKAAEQQTTAAASTAKTLDNTITGLKAAETVIDTGLMIVNPALGAALQGAKAGVDVARGDTKAATGRLIDAGVGLATAGAANLAFKAGSAAVRASPALTSATARVATAATTKAPTLTKIATKGVEAFKAARAAPVVSTVGKTISGTVRTGVDKVTQSAVGQTVKAGINKVTSGAIGQTVKAGVNKVTQGAVGQTVKAGVNKVTQGAVGQTVKTGINRVTSSVTGKAIGQHLRQTAINAAGNMVANTITGVLSGSKTTGGRGDQGQDADALHGEASKHGGEGIGARTNLGSVEGVTSTSGKQVRSQVRTIKENYNKTGRKGMKKFKDLQKKLLEDYTEGGSVFNGFADANPRRSAHLDYGSSQMGKGDSISRLNAFIHKFLMGSYLDVNAPVIELRSRLNHAGLDFPFDGTKIKLNPGINTFPLKLYGDVFGTTPTTDLSKGFDRGNNLPNMIMQINCSYDEDSCMWYLSGKIKPGLNATNAEINESITTLNELAPLAGALATIGSAALRVLPTAIRVGSEVARVGRKVAPVIKAVKAIKGSGKGSGSKEAEEVDSDPKQIDPLAQSRGLHAAAAQHGASDVNVRSNLTNVMGEYGSKKSDKMCEGGDCGKMTSGEAVYQSALAEAKNISGHITSSTKHSKQLAGKDTARAIMHAITRDGDIRKKILEPVYIHLAQKKRKGNLSVDQIQRELYYVVNAAQRKKGITLSKKEKDRVVNDLVRNFRRYASKYSTRQPDITRRKGKSKNSKKSK